MLSVHDHLSPFAAAPALRTLARPASLWNQRVLALSMSAGLQGGSLVDFTGRNPATLTGFDLAAHWGSGYWGPQLTFGGSQHVNCGSDKSLDDLAPVTYATWLRAANLSGAPRILFKNDAGGAGGQRSLSITALGAVNLFDRWGGANLIRTTVDGLITTNTWTHVALTWTGSQTASTVRMYVNGVEPAYQTTTNATGAALSDAAANLLVGDTWLGQLDAIGIWNRILTLAEIQALARAPHVGFRAEWPYSLVVPTGHLHPVTSHVDTAAVAGSQPLEAYTDAAKSWQFTFLDAREQAVTVDGHNLTLTVEDESGADLFTASATGSGSSGTFAVTSSDHADAGWFRYAVRDNSRGDAVLASESYRIREAAR